MNDSSLLLPTPAAEHVNSPGLESILASGAFPGRSTLFVAEVAQALRITKQHVINLIDEGFLSAIDVANCSNSKSGAPTRRALRIPVGSYDNYIRSRAGI